MVLETRSTIPFNDPGPQRATWASSVYVSQHCGLLWALSNILRIKKNSYSFSHIALNASQLLTLVLKGETATCATVLRDRTSVSN